MSKKQKGRDEGLEYIRLVMTSDLYSDTVPRPTKKVVGGFQKCGYTMHFVVSDRKDRRHGVVDEPAPLSDYAKNMLKAMFRRW